MNLNEIARQVHATSRAKGWWQDCESSSGGCSTGPAPLDRDAVIRSIPEKLALIHSEVSEALEDYRLGNMMTLPAGDDRKPVGFPSELADICIRVFDLAEALGIDIEAEVRRKAAFNMTRPHRHGGKRC